MYRNGDAQWEFHVSNVLRRPLATLSQDDEHKRELAHTPYFTVTGDKGITPFFAAQQRCTKLSNARCSSPTAMLVPQSQNKQYNPSAHF